MIYLTGVTNDTDEPALIQDLIGLMLQPGNSYHLRADRYPYFAADNGCFANRWTEDRWLDWLAIKVPRDGCLFAVAPDVYPDAQASLDRGRKYFDLIRDLGFPVAVVAQDGAENLLYPWDDFDCLFIGGERKANPKAEWKISDAAGQLVKRARSKGKWVHMGRVNSIARLERAREMGCHSADGTFIKYRKRTRAREAHLEQDMRTSRGAVELGGWMDVIDDTHVPQRFEAPALAVHRDAVAIRDRRLGSSCAQQRDAEAVEGLRTIISDLGDAA